MCILYVGYAYSGIGHPGGENCQGDFFGEYGDGGDEYSSVVDDNSIHFNWWPVIDDSIDRHSDGVLGQHLVANHDMKEV